MKVIMILTLLGTFFLSGLYAGGYNPGDKASDFKLRNVDGRYVSLGDYESAKGFVVVFTCNHCPYAQAYQDRLIDLNNKYLSKGFPLIAINPNDPAVSPGDSYSEMQKRANEKNYPFPYLFDETQAVYKMYGADRLGLILMAMAGYNPNEAVPFWQRMAAQSTNPMPAFLSTHPSDVNRIEQIKKYLPEAMKYYKKK
jgi:peroxiredoxin